MKLFELFPRYTRRDWEMLVERTVGGEVEKIFTVLSAEGLPVKLLYTGGENGHNLWARDGKFWKELFYSHRSRKMGRWEIRQGYLLGSVVQLAEKLERDGDRGVDSVWIKLAGTKTIDSGDGGEAEGWLNSIRGVDLSIVEDWKNVADLAGRKGLNLWFEVGADLLSSLSLFGKLSESEKGSFSALYVRFFGSFLEPGRTLNFIPSDYWRNIADFVRLRRGSGIPDRLFCFDGLVHNWSGASPPLELAGAIASAVEVMRNLEGEGLSLEEILSLSFFKLGVGREFFTELAKFRALRLLWSEISRQCSLENYSPIIPVHAVVSPVLFAKRDYWNNLLRGISGVLSAALGEADAITFIPFDICLGAPSELAERLAATFQLVASEESELYRVFDPAAGSWFIESLTVELASKAWEIFRHIERDGGFLAALRSGLWHQLLERDIERKIELFKSGDSHLLGVTIYPPPEDLEMGREKSSSEKLEDKNKNKSHIIDEVQLSKRGDELKTRKERPVGINVALSVSRREFSGSSEFSVSGGEELPAVRYITLEELLSLVEGNVHE